MPNEALEVDAQISWMRGVHAAALVLDRMPQPVIAAVPAHTSRAIKATLLQSTESDLKTTLWDVEPAAQARLICHPDFFSHAAAWLNSHAG